MSDETAFLKNILDDPDEDANRLVYADWLEERGDPRGELIRLQVGQGPLVDRDLSRLQVHDPSVHPKIPFHCLSRI